MVLISPSQESQLGLTEFQKMKRAVPVSHDAGINAMVQEVGRRIAAVVPMPNAQWEFVVFDDAKTVNAFCLPGGKVGIYTGILPLTKDATGLATVIGHEVSHAVARHGAERLSEGLIAEGIGIGLGELMRNKPAQATALALQAYGVGSALAVELPHSRKQESEADQLGLIYMARAGYDPRGAVEFWKRFAVFNSRQGGSPPQFLSTHPVDRVRIDQLQQLMPGAVREYEEAGGKL